MKKLIVGLAAVGAVVALRPVVKRRMVQKMREHCGQMAEHCKQMMGQFAAGGDTTGNEPIGPEAMRQKMREHCGQMASHDEERSEPLATV
jgi:hypothetical protein